MVDIPNVLGIVCPLLHSSSMLSLPCVHISQLFHNYILSDLSGFSSCCISLSWGLNKENSLGGYENLNKSVLTTNITVGWERNDTIFWSWLSRHDWGSVFAYFRFVSFVRSVWNVLISTISTIDIQFLSCTIIWTCFEVRSVCSVSMSLFWFLLDKSGISLSDSSGTNTC